MIDSPTPPRSKLSKLRAESEMKSAALETLLDILVEAAPDHMRPVFDVPKKANALVKTSHRLVSAVGDGLKAACDENELSVYAESVCALYDHLIAEIEEFMSGTKVPDSGEQTDSCSTEID